MIEVLRQRSREAAAAPAPAPPTLCAAELAACAAARQTKDPEGCVKAARSALHKDPSCGKAWAFLCWALFSLRRYDEVRRECRRALCYREWALRDRDGMAALLASCLLLSEMGPTVGDQLRDHWYQTRLRSLYDSSLLHKYFLQEVEETTHHDRYLGVDRHELSLLDGVPTQELREVHLGGDGGERTLPAGLLVGGDPTSERPRPQCYGGPNFPVEQALGGVVYLKDKILPFHCTPLPAPSLRTCDSTFPRTCDSLTCLVSRQATSASGQTPANDQTSNDQTGLAATLATARASAAAGRASRCRRSASRAGKLSRRTARRRRCRTQRWMSCTRRTPCPPCCISSSRRTSTRSRAKAARAPCPSTTTSSTPT